MQTVLALLVLIASTRLGTEARPAGCASESDAPIASEQYKTWCAKCGGTLQNHGDDAVAQGRCNLPTSGDATNPITLAQGDAPGAPEAERARDLEAKRSAAARRLQSEMLLEPRAAATPESVVEPKSAPGNRKPRRPLRTDPNAVAMQSQGDSPAPMRFEDLPDPPPPRKDAPLAVLPKGENEAFTRGFAHGNGCFVRNAVTACGKATPNAMAGCLNDYNRGFQLGDDKARERIDRAYRNGQRDKTAKATKSAQADAVGTCQNNILNAYEAGFKGWPHP